MDIEIKKYFPDEHSSNFLEDMLYEAIWVSDEKARPSREILKDPSLRKYIENWGRKGDIAFVALAPDSEKLIGAIWVRLFNKENQGFGFTSSKTPELSMAVAENYRGMGVGTALFKKLLRYSGRYFSSLSLSVDPDNPAKRLYHNFGFRLAGTNGKSETMLLELPPIKPLNY